MQRNPGEKCEGPEQPRRQPYARAQFARAGQYVSVAVLDLRTLAGAVYIEGHTHRGHALVLTAIDSTAGRSESENANPSSGEVFA